MTHRERICLIFLSLLALGIYKTYTRKPIQYDFKPQPPERDLTIKVPTNSASNYNLDKAYLNALENTNSNNATSVETSERDSKPKNP